MSLLPSRIAFLEPAGIAVLARLLPADPAIGLFSQDEAALRFASSYLRALSRAAAPAAAPRLVASLRWHALNPRDMLLLAFSEMTETEAQVRAGLLPTDEHSGLLPQSATGVRALVVSSDGQLIVQQRDSVWLPGFARTLTARDITQDASLIHVCAHMVQHCTGAPVRAHPAAALRALSLVVWERLQRWEIVYACDLRSLPTTGVNAEQILATLHAHGLSSFGAIPLEQACSERRACASAALATIVEQTFPLVTSHRPV